MAIFSHTVGDEAVPLGRAHSGHLGTKPTLLEGVGCLIAGGPSLETWSSYGKIGRAFGFHSTQ